ncbi:MAG: iron-sulfur cluster assembly scaffold protein [Parachlamydiaceae bacterium]
MGFEQLTHPFPWSLYSKRLVSKIENPRSVGIFTKDNAEERGMRLAEGTEGSVKDGNAIFFYWLVDKEDGMIVDVKFQAFGQTALIGAAEAASELLVGKNYDQALRITADLIDREVRDKEGEPAFPKETYPHLNLVLGAIEDASEKCRDLPLADSYIAPPVPRDIGEILEGGYPGWLKLPLKKKLAVIEDVLDRDIRPYIALDAGGVEVLNLINDREVVITYQGSCTSCYSSIGTTLSYIQQVLRAKVFPEIIVIPDVDPSSFH